MRVGVVAVLWVVIMGTFVMGSQVPPYFVLGQAGDFLSVYNMNVGFFGVIIELSLGNWARGLISNFRADRLEELQAQAYTDQLTGLSNRRYAEVFFEELNRSGQGGRWCVALMDIIRGTLRRTDQVFRWGGEEFLLVLCDVDITTAYVVLEKLRCALARAEVAVRGQKVGFTVTIGAEMLALSDIIGSIEYCDQKLYEGKGTGKNKVVL